MAYFPHLLTVIRYLIVNLLDMSFPRLFRGAVGKKETRKRNKKKFRVPKLTPTQEHYLAQSTSNKQKEGGTTLKQTRG